MDFRNCGPKKLRHFRAMNMNGYPFPQESRKWLDYFRNCVWFAYCSRVCVDFLLCLSVYFRHISIVSCKRNLFQTFWYRFLFVLKCIQTEINIITEKNENNRNKGYRSRWEQWNTIFGFFREKTPLFRRTTCLVFICFSFEMFSETKRRFFAKIHHISIQASWV